MTTKKILNQSIEALLNSQVILYTTDTVWGLGCDATNIDAVAKIFKLKNRIESKSLVVLVSSIDMFKSLAKNKILTCFHKYINIDDINKACKEGYSSEYFMLSTGISDADFDRLSQQYEQLKDNNIDLRFVCIDVANGYMFKLIEFCKRVRELMPEVTIVAGNVVSREITEELIIVEIADIEFSASNSEE